MFDPKKLLGDDLQGFADQFQSAMNDGGFNPMAMFTGQKMFHSVFLAPISDNFRAGVEEFTAHGTGPLEAVVEQLKQQGLDAAAASDQAKAMFANVQGMFVCVLSDDQGLSIIPQMMFGHLPDELIDHTATMIEQETGDQDGFRAAMVSLQSDLEKTQPWPQLFAAVSGEDDAESYWAELAEQLMAMQEHSIMPGMLDRLMDLAWWIVHAHRDLGHELDGDELYALARAGCVAIDAEIACFFAHQLLKDYEPEDEELAILIEKMVDTALRMGKPQLMVDFFKANATSLDSILGGCYELALPRFKALAAAMVSTDELIAGAEQLKIADKKAFRHDLGREPLWVVRVDEPGELVDTNEAADILDRSVAFVAKRLEHATIPVFKHDGEIRIPKQALLSWQTLMNTYQLLD